MLHKVARSLKVGGVVLEQPEKAIVFGVREICEEARSSIADKMSTWTAEIAVEQGHRALQPVPTVILVVVICERKVNRESGDSRLLSCDVKPEDSPGRLASAKIAPGHEVLYLIDLLSFTSNTDSEAGTVRT